MNLSNYCRLCAKENESFSTVVSPNFNGHIEKMIKTCCSIEILSGDNLPTKICQECYDKLQSSYTFRLQVSKAEKKLNRLIKELTKQSELARLLCADEVKQKKEDTSDEVKQKIEDTINEERKKKEDALNEERKNKEDALNKERKKKEDALRRLLCTDEVKPKKEDTSDEEDTLYEEKKKREETWKCYICGLTFSTNLPLKDHLKNIHRKDYYYFNKLELCDTCGKKFESKSLLVHHREQEHTNLNIRCPVSDCDKKFRTARGLSVHNSHAHNQNLFKCQICFKRYFVPQKLEKHMFTHSTVTDEQLPFGCGFCCKRFKNYMYCRVHELMHKNQNAYYCKKCNLCFANHNNLTKHTRESHCQICLDGVDESSCTHWEFVSKNSNKKRKISDNGEIEQNAILEPKIEDFEKAIPTFQAFKTVNIKSEIADEDPLVSTVVIKTETIENEGRNLQTEQIYLVKDNAVLAKRNLEEDPLKLPSCPTENINIRKVIIRKINLHPVLPKPN